MTRKEGVEGGYQFKDWGSRRILILAVVRKVPETAYNLDLIIKMVGLDQIRFTLTGDFAFLLPCFGLVKGCSAANPCLLCDQERSKVGGGKARWVETPEPSLRSFESLLTNYTGWVLEGEQPQAAKTKPWKSVTGPILVQGVGDTPATLVIDKVVPGPLHIYLAVNEVLNHCEKTVWPEMKTELHNVTGAQAHEYMGKVGNYEGPNIKKIFRKLDELKPYMLEGRKLDYHNALVEFSLVSKAVFGTELQPEWRQRLHSLRAALQTLTVTSNMPLTPKLHVLVKHVEQWVDRKGRALGKEGKSSGEALHHVWLRMVENQGEAKEKKSPADVAIILSVLLRFNADNC